MLMKLVDIAFKFYYRVVVHYYYQRTNKASSWMKLNELFCYLIDKLDNKSSGLDIELVRNLGWRKGQICSCDALVISPLHSHM